MATSNSSLHSGIPLAKLNAEASIIGESVGVPLQFSGMEDPVNGHSYHDRLYK